MDKRQLSKIGMASITEEQCHRDPAGAFHIAFATMRAAHMASVEQDERARTALTAPSTKDNLDETRG